LPARSVPTVVTTVSGFPRIGSELPERHPAQTAAVPVPHVARRDRRFTNSAFRTDDQIR
jgi:hypothetical protein